MNNKDKKKNGPFILLIFLALVVGAVGGLFFDEDFSFKGFELKNINIENFSDSFVISNFIIFLIAGFLLLFSFYYLIVSKTFRNKTPKQILDNNYDVDSDKKGSSRWLNKTEIDKIFPKYSFRDAPNLKVHGFLVQVVENGQDTFVNIKSDVHCLMVGTTGSGKTARFVIPTLQFLARTKIKPSLVVTDLKAELFINSSMIFQKNGYDLISINLREPLTKSSFWNPCHISFMEYQEALKQRSLIKFNYVPIDFKKTTLNIVGDKRLFKEEWYEYNNFAFSNLKDAIIETERQSNSLKSKALESINDLITTLYAEVTKRATDPFWPKSAASLVEGLLIAMLEDSEISDLNISSQKFNIGTIVSTLALRVKSLDNYFILRGPESFAKRRAQGAIEAPKTGTQQSIVSSALAELTAFADPDVLFVTCNNNINLKNIGRKPTIVFLIVPDEKENRHIFASLFFTQAYKSLVELATENGGKCPHPVYFIVDEFANLPVIPGMENKITVSRSRGISFMLIIQALSQLRAKYGEDVAEIIKTNCNLQIFLATNDTETAEYFSKICGKKTVKEVQINRDPEGKESSSWGLSERALILPEELLTLQENYSIIKLLRTHPAKLGQINYWKSKTYLKAEAKLEYTWTNQLFSFEKDAYYDINNRSFHDVSFLNIDYDEYEIEKTTDKKSLTSQNKIIKKPIELDDDDEDDDDDDDGEESKILTERNEELSFIEKLKLKFLQEEKELRKGKEEGKTEKEKVTEKEKDNKKINEKEKVTEKGKISISPLLESLNEVLGINVNDTFNLNKNNIAINSEKVDFNNKDFSNQTKALFVKKEPKQQEFDIDKEIKAIRNKNDYNPL